MHGIKKNSGTQECIMYSINYVRNVRIILELNVEYIYSIVYLGTVTVTVTEHS
jgi:hypothetical protein